MTVSATSNTTKTHKKGRFLHKVKHFALVIALLFVCFGSTSFVGATETSPPVMEPIISTTYECGNDYATVSTTTFTNGYVWNGSEWISVWDEPTVSVETHTEPHELIPCAVSASLDYTG